MARRKKPKQKFPRGKADEAEEEEDKGGWKAWARDIAVAVIIMVVILGGIWAYTQVWPPLVVVESSSMQHGHTSSAVGVIDTGDLVLVQTAPAPSDVVTYLEGRASGYTTYGDYGDVIIFRIYARPGATPIIHRAIMYVTPNGTDAADVPDLAALPRSQWQGVDRLSRPTNSPYGLTSVWIREMGYNHDLNITFDLAYFASKMSVEPSSRRGTGYITMGDNNAYDQCQTKDPCNPGPYDKGWFPIQSDIIGHARGEIPWFGLIKLLLSPAPGGCCQSWGDSGAPRNSWDSLAISLVFLIALPFIVEGGAWAWSTYAWPWIKPRLRRGKEEAPPPKVEEAPEEAAEGGPHEDGPDDSTGGSSGP